MPWDRKRLLGYVETIQLILGVTDKIDQTISHAVQTLYNIIGHTINHTQWLHII